MNQLLQRRLKSLAIALLICISMFGMATIAYATDTEESPSQVKVPIKVSTSDAVAGVEVECELSSGLTLVSFEKSDVVKAASITPIVEKNGKTYFGIFMAENECIPEKGKLDIGNLVFDYTGEPDQKVTITSIKFATVIDKDNVETNTVQVIESIAVPTTGGLVVGGSEVPLLTLILIGVAIAIVIVVLVVVRNNKKKKTLAN